jgi:UDP-glucose 4-epimerase
VNTMKWSNAKVLVTGGAGFIGSSIAKKLLEGNADVVVLDNFAEGPRNNVPKGCEIVEADIRDEESLSKLMDIDYVFHFGAPSSIILFNKNPSACVNVTVCGFVNLLEWAHKVGVKKVVFPSSGSVYGSTSPPQSEDAVVQPMNLYGVAKFTCENIARLYGSLVQTAGLRIFAGYGPGEEHKGSFASPVALFLGAIAKGEKPVVYGDGSQSRDFVYIDDVVEAAMKAAESNFTGVVNVGSGKSHSFNAVIGLINEVLCKNIEPLYVNKPAKYLERTLADTRKMFELLNIRPLDLKEGIQKYAQTIGINH